MKSQSLFSRIDSLNLAVIFSFLVLVSTHLPASYQSYKIRHRVLAGLEHANRVKELVAANALKRQDLAHDWADTVAGEAEGIRVDSYSGVITITYPKDIDDGGKTLALVPIYLRGHELYPLASVIHSNISLKSTDIVWVCTSKLTLSTRTFIAENRGTLRGKYSPIACRLPWSESEIEKRMKAPLNSR